jgi:hypothetical protein
VDRPLTLFLTGIFLLGHQFSARTSGASPVST